MEELKIRTREREEMMDITGMVSSLVHNEGADPDVAEDLLL